MKPLLFPLTPSPPPSWGHVFQLLPQFLPGLARAGLTASDAKHSHLPSSLPTYVRLSCPMVRAIPCFLNSLKAPASPLPGPKARKDQQSGSAIMLRC